MNYITEARIVVLTGIDSNKNLPDQVKTELKKIMSDQFGIMGRIIGTTELILLRETKK